MHKLSLSNGPFKYFIFKENVKEKKSDFYLKKCFLYLYNSDEHL